MVCLQAILVEPATGANAPVWRGPLSGEKSEAAITMSAYAFDTLVRISEAASMSIMQKPYRKFRQWYVFFGKS